jgi:hypothetical protein
MSRSDASKTLLCAALATALPAAAELAPVDDETLQAVSGADGIAANLWMYINADADGTPIPCPTAAQHANGTPECRLALQFAAREDENVWLVIKDYYGVIRLNNVWIDAANADGGDSTHRDITTYLGGYNPNGKPVVQLSYDHSGISATAAAYDDADWLLSLGRITAEYDAAGVPGYLRSDVSGSALGLTIADGVNGSGGPANMRFDGRMQMYGF